MTPARSNLFDRLVGWSLANRLFVLAAALALLAAGAFGLQRLPVDVFPDLDKPTVTLMTFLADRRGWTVPFNRLTVSASFMIFSTEASRNESMASSWPAWAHMAMV